MEIKKYYQAYSLTICKIEGSVKRYRGDWPFMFMPVGRALAGLVAY